MTSGFVVSVGERAALERVSRSGCEPWRRVRPARALLALADGGSVRGVARRMGAHQDTVRRWRDEFGRSGVEGLGAVAPGRGRKPSVPAGVVEAIVADTLAGEPPDGAVCWSTRQMAARHGVGKDFVARVWRERGLRPWLADVFKVSADPDFEAKLADVIGLYVNPPERAVVFSFDEKTQIQALDRTQPSLPMRPGRNRTLTHDYKRNGTIDLFAALNVATGEVLHQTRRRHTGGDVLAFFRWIDLHTPRHLDVHVILDNVSAHKSEPVRKWLAHPRRRRWHLHFTPTSSSWANLVEGWFSILTRKALRTRSFASVADLKEAIDHWAAHWNHDPQPLRWTKTAEHIIAKVKRARTALNKTATHH
ncbi:IS630 family transposase [Candidatus Poriferisodalis sp.]|uniref:IS630 family transposase n=1 Tax=Candidatus Poriferisodalis sp. TaxID=3101277 RepID=UPI003B02B771